MTFEQKYGQAILRRSKIAFLRRLDRPELQNLEQTRRPENKMYSFTNNTRKPGWFSPRFFSF
jgi:hypothetical protein